MVSPFLLQANDGTDIGYNKAIVDAVMVVAQGGDRRTFTYLNYSGTYSYLGVARATNCRTYLSTDAMPTRTGILWNVTTDGQMATALAGAVPGDWIVVALGTYTGFYAPGVKAGDTAPGTNNTIVIISKAVYDSMPGGSGTATVLPPLLRVVDGDSANMPNFKNISLANQEQWAFDGNTRGFRFVGIRFSIDATVTQLGRLVRAGSGDPTVQAGPTTSPQNIGFDRCHFNGHALCNLKAALEFHGRSLFAQECYFGDQINHDGQDCKAIASYNGPGPVRVVNNRIAATTENILIGGSYSTPGCCPADWEVRWNRFEKPLTWNPFHPSYAGKNWSVKNLFEVKKLQYGLIEGNYLHRVWAEDQAGAAFLIKSESYGDGPQNGYTKDIIVRWNLVEDASYGINIAGVNNVENAVAPQRVWSVGNLYVLGAQYFDASQNPYIGSGLFNTCGSIHDTFVSKGTVNSICQPEGGQTNMTFLDTIFCHTNYGIKGSGQTDGLPTLLAFCPGYDIRKCVFVGVDSTKYPPGNSYVAGESQVGFTNFAGGDFSLSGTSQVIVPTTPPPTVPVAGSVVLVQSPGAGTSGIALAQQPRVRVLDTDGATLVVNGTATVSVIDGNGTIVGGGTINIVAGLGTASGLAISVPADDDITLRFTYSTFTVDAAPIAIGLLDLTITTAASDGADNVVLATQPVIQLRDSLGVALARSGVTVNVAVIGPNGSIVAGGSAVTNGSGVATFTTLKLSVDLTAIVSLRYSATGANPVDEDVVITGPTAPGEVGTVTQLVCTRTPSGAKNGRPLRTQGRWEWQDENGVTVTSCTAVVTLTVTGNATTIGTNALAAVAGVADFAGSGFGISGRGKVTIIASGTP